MSSVVKRNVLFVDDESKILTSIKITLHREPYRVYTAESGAEALELLKSVTIDVIISDMRMPEMDGIEFLKRARPLAPEAVLMILSGYSDISKIMEAINEQHIWRYICKPWKKEELILGLSNAIEMFDHKKARKELLIQLAQANNDLEEHNEQLEEKIKERTTQLRDKNQILSMLVEDIHVSEILSLICQSVCRVLDGATIQMSVPFLNQTYSNHDVIINEKLASMVDTVLKNNEKKYDLGHLLLPITKGEEVLGVLTVKKHIEDMHQILSTLDEYVPLITLCLAQAKNLEDTPGLSDKIDTIIGTL